MTVRGPYLTEQKLYAFWDENGTGDQAQDVKLARDKFDLPRRRDVDRVKRLWQGWEIPERLQEPEPVVLGTMTDPAERRMQVDTSKARTYVFTCAQNNTEIIPKAWWDTLLNLVDYYDAELHVSQFTYNKAAYGKNSVKPGSKKASDSADVYYAQEIAEYVSNEDIQITDDLVWLGSVNLSPSLVNPLTGWQTHTRQASAIIPHTKMAMESVATMKVDPARFLYTTGTVTQRNYIQKAAGQKADFHHVFGALIVQVDERGEWWVRQLNFDKDGGLYDLNRFFTEDEVYENVRVDAVTHGDIHGDKMDKEVCDTVFGPAGMLDHLMPRHQFFHDIIDFMPRNHHNRNDFQFIHDMWRKGKSSVVREFNEIAHWLMHDAHRDWCQSHVVVSNHDQAVNGWLADRRGLDDPTNLETWLDQNLKLARYKNHHPFKAMLRAACIEAVQTSVRVPPHVIKEDESFKLNDVEYGIHGHLGPNGARGAPRNIRVVGKANTGHTHSAGIVEGVYTAGVLGQLDMGYNKGASSWSHSSIITYPNGKRTIVTLRAGKWWR